ncbi:MAG: TetR/AcrR family transcriptional regulator [Terriglobia bacterium]
MTQTGQPSRTRLLLSARKLFADQGYEGTSTASIARAAGTSESQLIKHFGGKAGLLDSIFVDGWTTLTAHLEQSLAATSSPIDRLRIIPRLMFDELERDPELRQLLLLEGRRIRKEGRLATLTDGFIGFVKLVDATLDDMRAAGQLRTDLNPQAIRSALIGLTEGALRDQLLSERAGHPSEFTVENIGTLVDALVQSIAA